MYGNNYVYYRTENALKTFVHYRKTLRYDNTWHFESSEYIVPTHLNFRIYYQFTYIYAAGFTIIV